MPPARVLGEYNGDNNVAGRHPNGTDRQHGLPSDAVDVEHSRHREEEHDDPHDTGREKTRRVVIETELLEDGRCVVENCIDACPAVLLVLGCELH